MTPSPPVDVAGADASCVAVSNVGAESLNAAAAAAKLVPRFASSNSTTLDVCSVLGRALLSSLRSPRRRGRVRTRTMALCLAGLAQDACRWLDSGGAGSARKNGLLADACLTPQALQSARVARRLSFSDGCGRPRGLGDRLNFGMVSTGKV